MIPKAVLRSVVAVVAGILVISMAVEGLELGLVTLVNGEFTNDVEQYFSVRNRPWFLALKLVYNTGAAVGAGYLTALIAGHAELKHGAALAVVQTLAFAFALTQPDMRVWTPDWMWGALMVLTAVGIILGSRLQTVPRTAG